MGFVFVFVEGSVVVAIANCIIKLCFVLTTECLIAERPEKSAPAPGGGGGGGGMPGMGGMGGF